MKTQYHNITITVESTEGEIGMEALKKLTQSAVEPAFDMMFPHVNMLGVEVMPAPIPTYDTEV